MLWKKIVQRLTAQGQTVTAMESCTGGGIANAITDISGASDVFAESFVTYSNHAKVKLGVSREVIEAYSVYSVQTAAEMAQAALAAAQADWAIGVTGQLGRIDPANPVDRMNIVCFAIASRDGRVRTWEMQVKDTVRSEQKEQVIERIAEVFFGLLDEGGLT